MILPSGELIEIVDARRAPMIPVSATLAALIDRPTGPPLVREAALLHRAAEIGGARRIAIARPIRREQPIVAVMSFSRKNQPLCPTLPPWKCNTSSPARAGRTPPGPAPS
jgi:hypothetical protein